MDDVRIVSVDAQADDGLLEQYVDVTEESGIAEFGDRHTTYSVKEIRARQRTVTDQTILLFAGLAGRDVVAAGALQLPRLDNLHLAGLDLTVRPRCRRRGVGTLMLHRLEALAAEHGRTTIAADSEAALGHQDPAEAFCELHGYQRALVDLRSDLDVPAEGVDPLLLPLETDAAAHAAGYDVRTWWDGVPEQWLDQRAYLSSRMSTDAPLGDLQVEEEAWDADRLLEQFAVLRAQGRRLVETVALERATGRLAAFTQLSVPQHTPEMAYQWDTLVLKEHRGRRLGQLVKAANLRALLAELPHVRRIVTWNAQVNEPMLRVNRAMGFRPVGTLTEWQKVPRVPSSAAGCG